MPSFRISGGYPLHGEVTPQGAKNEAVQVICATMLTSQPVRISNIPNITDVNRLIEIVMSLGSQVTRKKNTCQFEASFINFNFLHTQEFYKKAGSMRASLMLLAPLLTRCKKAFIPKPGGDKIGRRRVDAHFTAFQKLGARFTYNSKKKGYEIVAPRRLKGTDMILEEASVTGTANIIMAASLAKGKTTIYNAACEPYIQQLCLMLNRMGAAIEGIGSNLLTIKGVDQLDGTSHTLLPDMIEIGSFIGMATMTQSEITIKNCHIEQLGIIPSTFEKLGISLTYRGDDIYIPSQRGYEIKPLIDCSILSIADAPWPGLTPDLLSILLVVAIQAKGTLLIHQKMFESRLFFVDKLIEMGAQIILCDPHRATVIGLNQKYPLQGITMSSPDIRAGIALLIAALSAQGESEIHNIEQIERGYENIDKRLRKLGAHIRRIS